MRNGNARKIDARGETLVETIVSFALLLLLLGIVGTVVAASIRLNNRAQAGAESLENACALIETGGGEAQGGGTLAVSIAASQNGLVPAKNVNIPVEIRSAEPLGYFAPEAEP